MSFAHFGSSPHQLKYSYFSNISRLSVIYTTIFSHNISISCDFVYIFYHDLKNYLSPNINFFKIDAEFCVIEAFPYTQVIEEFFF